MVAVNRSVLPLSVPYIAGVGSSSRSTSSSTTGKANQAAHQAALLTDVQDDLASLLAAVMRRQPGRRAGSDTADSSAQEYEPLPTPSNIESVAQIRQLLAEQQPRWRMAMDLLRGLFPDPAEQAVVLAGLRSDPKLSEEIREQIKAALTELATQHGEELANSAKLGRVVAQFSERTGLSPETLRQAYRTLILVGAGERELYLYLIETFGFAQRGLAVDFLEQTVAINLGVDHSAYTSEIFRPLLDLLLQLRLIRCADDILLSTLRRKMRRQIRRSRSRSQSGSRGQSGGREQSSGQSKKYATGLIEEALITLLLAALSDVGSAQRQFAQFVQRLGTYTERGALQFLARAILRAMARIPCELFPDLIARQALLTALHLTYDQLFATRHIPVYRTHCYV